MDQGPQDRTAMPAACSVCWSPLLGDPDDQVGPPLGPMCGECYRAREFDQTLWELDVTSELDDGTW